MTVAVLPFLAFAAAQIGTPGPANMALVASGASFGVRRSLPFIGGVVLGKQIVIWPLGMGLLSLQESAPLALAAMKWISLAIVLWIAWRIASSRLRPSTAGQSPFSFWLGLLVHPFNPKAWAMITWHSLRSSRPGHRHFRPRPSLLFVFWQPKSSCTRSGHSPATALPAVWPERRPSVP